MQDVCMWDKLKTPTKLLYGRHRSNWTHIHKLWTEQDCRHVRSLSSDCSPERSQSWHPHSSLMWLVEASSILKTMPALLSRSMSGLPMAEAGVSTPPCSMPARLSSSS